MKHRIIDNITADYYEIDEPVTNDFFDKAQYIFVDSLSEDIDRINNLKNWGFEFHERMILTSIFTGRLEQNLTRFVKYDVSEGKEISDELKEIAVRAYPADRRFHINRYYDEKNAKNFIISYLDELSKEDLIIYSCKHHQKMIGYTILKEVSNGIFENLLGAVMPEYQSRGAAFALYAGMLISMKEKGYKEYTGWISTKNIASLNLHIALGGVKFSVSKDRYVKRLL